MIAVLENVDFSASSVDVVFVGVAVLVAVEPGLFVLVAPIQVMSVSAVSPEMFVMIFTVCVPAETSGISTETPSAIC
jgi:hypothetical protein